MSTRALVFILSLAALLAAPLPAAATGSPKVYLLRGFMNVFSLGLDELAAKIDRTGVRAEVYNHTSWSRLAGQITTEYNSGKTRPVILIGHSWGGLDVVNLVEALGKSNVPVALAVTLDTTSVTIEGGQVATFLNLYASSGALKAGSGFRGKLINQDLAGTMDVGHFNIDKLEPVHAIIMRHVSAAVGRTGTRKPPAAARSDRMRPFDHTTSQTGSVR
jgi:pimeloyl-ACP methyl ester carboxylesterase